MNLDEWQLRQQYRKIQESVVQKRLTSSHTLVAPLLFTNFLFIFSFFVRSNKEINSVSSSWRVFFCCFIHFDVD